MNTQDIIDLLIKGYEINPYVVDYVKKVKNAGYKTAICSSNFPARIKGLQRRFGFLDDSDVITLSFEVGVNKPEKQLYEELIKKSGVEPLEIIYSDDYEPAISAAKNLGISTFLYTDFGAFVKHLEGLGVRL